MLYIIRKRLPGANYNFSDYLFATLRGKDDIRLIDLVEDKPKGILPKLSHNAIKVMQSLLPPSDALMSRIFGADFVKSLKQIGNGDKVLIFDIWNLKYQLFIKKYLKDNDVKSFIWDSVSAFYKTDKLKPKYIKAKDKISLYTFDPGDVRRYGFNMAGQVYRCDAQVLSRCQSCADEDKFDVFYVGQDLGRTEMFIQMIKSMSEQDIEAKFWIVPPKKEKRNEFLAPYYMEKFVPYDVILDQLVKCRCIVEMTKPRQEGWTLRTLEALFYGKKLITNNKSILNAPFYNKSNIYVLGHDEGTRSLRDFMHEPMVAVDLSMQQPYMIEYWISQFV